MEIMDSEQNFLIGIGYWTLLLDVDGLANELLLDNKDKLLWTRQVYEILDVLLSMGPQDNRCDTRTLQQGSLTTALANNEWKWDLNETTDYYLQQSSGSQTLAQRILSNRNVAAEVHKRKTWNIYKLNQHVSILDSKTNNNLKN